MAVGDPVCIILGINTPFLLRPIGENYQVVGECYPYGFMEGQAIKMAVENDLEARKFILV